MTNNNNSDIYYKNSCDLSKIDSICLGSGRFLRSVLIPLLSFQKAFSPAIFQTRGNSFLTYIANGDSNNSGNEELLSYEVDTIQHDGTIDTEQVTCCVAGTLGSIDGRDGLFGLLDKMKDIRIIGVGVTEAGLASASSQALIDLTDILFKCYTRMNTSSSTPLKCSNPNGRICIINTDNVPHNGNLIQSHIFTIIQSSSSYEKKEDFIQFIKDRVVFHNSMVDRIVSQRPDSNGMVPRCEPIPKKALVIEDLSSDLPQVLSSSLEYTEKFGLCIRTNPSQLDTDIALKLRIANGTHTALAHIMALSKILLTDILSASKASSSNNNTHDDDSDSTTSSAGTLLMKYVDTFFHSQISLGTSTSSEKQEMVNVYQDWRKRLCHKYFGLSTFFITQNGAAKGGIRITPTIHNLIMKKEKINITTAFILAAILRFLTPISKLDNNNNESKVSSYVGWLDNATDNDDNNNNNDDDKKDETDVVYADGLKYNLHKNWYQFKCNCPVDITSQQQQQQESISVNLPDALMECHRSTTSTTKTSSYSVKDVVLAYLVSKSGGNMQDLYYDESDETKTEIDYLAECICVLYSHMINGSTSSSSSCLGTLKDIVDKNGAFEKMCVNGLETSCKDFLST